MGSVFTYDPDPPKVLSPWLLPLEPAPSALEKDGLGSDLSQRRLTKLVAEPQDGPTEYKLHLLLRPRRNYASTSTVAVAPGSQHGKTSLETPAKTAPPILSSSRETRQTRLQHLTTQLLWRLQQSSPFHASTSNKDLVLPRLSGDGVDLLHAPPKIGKLLSGLEESRGALYEIGVADDGTLVGLTRGEMDESLATLRVMAASLGCAVEVLRTVVVGDCEWTEHVTDYADDTTSFGSRSVSHKAKLWVTEALVAPVLGVKDCEGACATDPSSYVTAPTAARMKQPERNRSTTAQLRVTLTGPTTSGKSTLLGTLSTGLLDNGRGKSRLNLLRHRHEVASGITSSVAQELIGYKDKDIFNYTHGIIESWVEIHDRSDGGRLVFVSDSAGHPRYRRTVLRGLVGWDPHWTVLCIAADDADMSSVTGDASSTAKYMLEATGEGIDLAQAHLDLCLKLETPLALVITKLDLGNRSVLMQTMNKVLTSIKGAGRTPRIIQPDQNPCPNLTRIPKSDHAKVAAVTDSMGSYKEAWSCVPIILTSAVTGRGMGLVHALLQTLPMPPIPTSCDFIGQALNPEQPQTLFHIDDTFSLPAAYAHALPAAEQESQNQDEEGEVKGKEVKEEKEEKEEEESIEDKGCVVAGYLRFGNLTVGDKVLIGPFPSEDDDTRTPLDEDRGGAGYELSISHPSSAELARITMRDAVAASAIKGEWHEAKIVSVRNLRLPVMSLDAGQTGSIGLKIDWPKRVKGESVGTHVTQSVSRIRKGMVIAIPSRHMSDTVISLQAASGFTASFKDPEAESLITGSLVNVYVACVRAAARILRVWPSRPSADQSAMATEETTMFNLVEHDDSGSTHGDAADVGSGRANSEMVNPVVEVSFELLTNREWIEMGSKVIVMEGGRRDKSGLEGYVGRVTELVD